MQHTDYTTQREYLINRFASTFPMNDTLQAQFALVSAGLYNFLPSVPYEKHPDIFKNILLHQQLSMLEQSSYQVLEQLTYENNTTSINSQLRQGPNIICTFHTGSYRAVNLWLTKNKIPFSLVIGKKVIAESGDLFTKLFAQLPGHHNPAHFSLIDAEASGSGLRMLRELKKGNSLLLYIDGNSGSGENTAQNDNSCLIDFLAQQIFVRKGICYLAHAAGVPVLPVICYRHSFTDTRLRFCEPFFPYDIKDRNEFAHTTTQQLYHLLAPYVRNYPEQWEAWLYLHKTAHIKPSITDREMTERIPAATDEFIFNSTGFGIFREEHHYFLFRKAGYVSYPIDIDLYRLLTACLFQPVMKQKIHTGLFNQLYEKKVLVFA